MARDVDKEDANAREPAKAESAPSTAAETSAVDKHE
jgi:hypothetical protein